MKALSAARGGAYRQTPPEAPEDRRPRGLLSGGARELALRNLDVVRETYQLGRLTLFDVLNEQRRYLDFESGYTEALAEAFAARTALQRATGVMR